MWGRGWCSGSASAVLSCIGTWRSDDLRMTVWRWMVRVNSPMDAWQSDDVCMTVRWFVHDSPAMIGVTGTTQVTIYWCESYVIRERRVYATVTKWCHRVACYEGAEAHAFPVQRRYMTNCCELDVIEYYIVIWGYMTVLLWVNCMHDLYVSTWRLSGTFHDDLFHLRS